jgi:hypothetical protein
MKKSLVIFSLALGIGGGAASVLLSGSPAEQRTGVLETARVCQANKSDDKQPAESPLNKLKEGYRSFTIKVQASARVIVSGANVDLLCVVPDPKNPKFKMARMFMEDVRVIDVEPSKTPDHLLITLALSPKQCEMMFWTVTQGEGTYMLVGRNPNDRTHVATYGATTPFGRGDPPEKE